MLSYSSNTLDLGAYGPPRLQSTSAYEDIVVRLALWHNRWEGRWLTPQAQQDLWNIAERTKKALPWWPKPPQPSLILVSDKPLGR